MGKTIWCIPWRLWDSMWNTPWNWNYHGTGRFLVFIRICPRGITTKKGFVLHENSMEYFTWNLTESLWKNSYVLPTWYSIEYKTGTSFLQRIYYVCVCVNGAAIFILKIRITVTDKTVKQHKLWTIDDTQNICWRICHQCHQGDYKEQHYT